MGNLFSSIEIPSIKVLHQLRWIKFVFPILASSAFIIMQLVLRYIVTRFQAIYCCLSAGLVASAAIGLSLSWKLSVSLRLLVYLSCNLCSHVLSFPQVFELHFHHLLLSLFFMYAWHQVQRRRRVGIHCKFAKIGAHYLFKLLKLRRSNRR